jgi:putative endonuclease
MFYIYFVTNKQFNVLYIGVTNNLIRRVYEHKNKLTEGFTKKYNTNRLVYFETHETIEAAIAREKKIKGWVRKKKDALINQKNPMWNDLYKSLL